MAFPPSNETFGAVGSATLEQARAAWTRVAQTLSRYEPVTVLADPRDVEAARTWLGDGIPVIPVPLDDAWLRDTGPTFTHRKDGSLAAVDWVFNGWGAQEWAAWDNDQNVARAVASASGVPLRPTSLVNEGGGFHVDGEGTVLLTETVQLDPERNPGGTKESVEAEIHAALGTTKAIWLPRGLTRDYDEFGTRGHVDIVAAFAGPGTVLLHRQNDPTHPDHAVYLQLKTVLQSETDAQGRPLHLIDIPAPTTLKDDEGYVDWSYINHYVANNVVVLCSFGDPNDAIAADILQRAYPGRTVELVDARDIFAFGGGIHCITQQQPAPASANAEGNAL
jgi:agmatine deiminase